MWHEAKKSEKKVHELMDTARKRAMRRAEFLAKRRGDPLQSIQLCGSRCRVHRDDGLYQAAQDQIGLIAWNGKEDNLIDRFDGRALLDFIRESSSRPFKSQDKTEEEEELEQFVTFERYRDLIKHRRRGFSEDDGLKHVQQELEAKKTASLNFNKPKKVQPKGTYSQVGFSYGKSGGETLNQDLDSDEDDDSDDDVDGDDDEFSSDDSNDEKMERIAKDFGIRRYNYLVYMEKKSKEEEKRQKELIKGDPSIKKLSRRERRKISQVEREKERESARFLGRGPQYDPYRDPRRSPSYETYSRRRRSRSRSPSEHSRRHERESSSKSKAPKIEYITEFGALSPRQTKDDWFSPPSSPVHHSLPVPLDRLMGGENKILEALHSDPAAASRTIEQDKTPKFVKAPLISGSSGLAKLSKGLTGGPSKSSSIIGEKKETPQERLKRIMSQQLNKQIKKDTAVEIAKKREQEKERRERLAELSRLSRRSRSRSSDRSRDRSREPSRSRSPPRRRSRHSRSPRRRYRSRSRSASRRRSITRSPSPRSRNRSRR